jgi:alkylhydroperoxidase/carboxymuconolactone decarboxylase family protein YurZ
MMPEPHLDPKTQLLIALGSAVAAKCQACFAGLYTKVGEVEATEPEVRAAVSIGTKVAGKSHDFMAVFVEETTKGAVAASGEGTEAGTGECC